MILLIVSIFLLSTLVNFSESYTVIYENSEKYCVGNQYTHIYDYLKENRYCFRLRWCDAEHCCEHECGAYSWRAETISILNTELVPAGAFADSEKLVHISGIQRGITTLGSKSFANLENVVDIDLSFNKIKYIQHDVFVNVSATSLDLRFNKIVYIEQDAFSGLADLENLYLDYNELSYIYAFPKDSELKILKLSHNFLQRLVISSERYPNLVQLDASYNNLTNVAITSRNNMSSINLNGNELKRLDVFQVENLAELSIKLNKFEDIQASIFEHVQTIYLHPNPIESSKIEELSKHCSIPGPSVIRDNSVEIDQEFCTDDSMCPRNKICRRNICYDPCIFDVCDNTSTCETKNHVFSCPCKGNSKRNPAKYRSRCYDVECFLDEDCPDKVICDPTTNKCDPSKHLSYSGGSSTMFTYPWYYDEIDPVLGQKVYEQNFQMSEQKNIK